MKRLYRLLIGCLLLSRFACAQDVVYLNDQTSVVGTLAEVSAEKVTLRVAKGQSLVKFSYGIDRIVAIINQRGRFLCMSYVLSLPATDRDRLIAQFMTVTDPPATDMIIRRNPAGAIYGKIAYDRGDAITYTAADGKASSLAKADVVAIFYRAGKHQLVGDILTLCAIATQLPDALAVSNANQKPTQAASAVYPAIGQPEVTPPVAPAGSQSPLDLTAEQYENYRSQALERVKEFSVLLGVVADKAVDSENKNKAISQIVRLFKPDATIQVSSAVSGQAPTYKLKDYLIRLKLLPYKSVSLEWTDIQYVQDLAKKDDGNYYGKIRGEQRFTGLNGKGEVQYGDVTQKDVDVMLTPYQKTKEGLDQSEWAILLGNVGVVATQ